MASREETLCDPCADEGVDTPAVTAYLGFASEWWQLELCERHQVALLGGLEALLDSVGIPVSGPPLNL